MSKQKGGGEAIHTWTNTNAKKKLFLKKDSYATSAL